MAGVTTALEDLVGTARSGTQEKKAPSSNLGKDDFLKLLVTQMQYQNPLEPKADTEFVAQLAQFSSLEQMQNLSATSANSQAMSLVGKEVVVSTKSATGQEMTVTGTVDFVSIKKGEAYLSIEGNLYKATDVVSVMDDFYAIQKWLPSVKEQKLEFDQSRPQDVELEVNLGSGSYEAPSVAVAINGTPIDPNKMHFSDGKLTIEAEALKDLKPGVYIVELYFQDVMETTIKDKVTIRVTNEPIVPDEPGEIDEPGESEESIAIDDETDNENGGE